MWYQRIGNFLYLLLCRNYFLDYVRISSLRSPDTG